MLAMVSCGYLLNSPEWFSPFSYAFRVADPALGQTILQRRKDFVQAPIAAKIVGLLGPNLLGVSVSSPDTDFRLLTRDFI